MVKQLIAALDLPPSVLNSDEVPVDSTSTEHLASPDLDAPHMYHGQTGTAVVTFHDHTDVAGPPEPVSTPFTVSPSGAPMFLLYQEPETADHAVTAVSAMQSVLVDYGSTLNTVGDSSLIRNYESPSPSPIKMRSATGHIVRPRGQGVLPFQFNDGTGSLAIQCQHTPDIASSIFSLRKLANDWIMILTRSRVIIRPSNPVSLLPSPANLTFGLVARMSIGFRSYHSRSCRRNQS
jgi:hypothetical protein